LVKYTNVIVKNFDNSFKACSFIDNSGVHSLIVAIFSNFLYNFVMITEGQPKEIPNRPLMMIDHALRSAAQGISPYQNYGGESSIFRATLLQSLGLASDIRDGKQLMQRFVSPSHLIKDLMQTVSVEAGIDALLQSGLKNQTNPHQEQLGTDLAAIAARQFVREGAVCPGVAGMVLSAPERFLREFPGLQEQVFEKDIDQAVSHRYGNIADGRLVSHTFLRGFGLNPPVHKDFQPPSGLVFIREDNFLIRVTPERLQDVTVVERSNLLSGLAERLDPIWVQSSSEQTPHPLLPAGQRRYLRRLARE
jgi:hypothetical protein